jgi:LPS-assembly lipoprotein
MNLRNSLLIFSLACLCACGFQLRGSNLDALQGSSFYIKSSGNNSLAREVKKQLAFAEIRIVNSSQEADYVVELGNESFNRKILSVSADTGKVEEYELHYSTSLTVTDAAGKSLANNDPITAQRDFTFDEDTVLGKFDEEKKLREEIREYAAASIVRRLRYFTQ